jgi:hypothetical protein
VRVSSPSFLTVVYALLAIGIGVSLVAVPVVRGVLVALAVIGFTWAVILPRGWYPRGDVKTRRVIAVFLGIRMLMPIVSAVVAGAAALLFTGGTDADKYHDVAVRVANELLLTGHASAHGTQIPGSSAVELVVGYFYAFAAPIRLLSYYVSNFLAMIGMLLFWWATEHLVPDQRRRRYTAFILLTPTLLFWNAGLGKEAPLMFATGCMVAGFHVLSGRSRAPRGFAYLALGVVVGGFVRPHIVLLLMLSGVVGFVFGGARAASGRRRRRLLPLAVVGAFAILVLPATHSLLDPAGGRSLVKAAYDTAETTADVGGRSAFETAPTRSVSDVPGAIVTVLLRPFPWEVRTVPQLLASAEAAAIGFLFFRSLWRVMRRRMRFTQSPLVVSSGVFVLLFCLVFSSLGNFGLLVRERMQVLPFVILLTFSVIPVPARVPGAEPADRSRRRLPAPSR